MTEKTRVRDDLPIIGVFAARARLSARALRLYDRLGLLSPARADAATGYRCCRPEQVERARRVAPPRRLDRPPAVVAEVLGARRTGRCGGPPGGSQRAGRTSRRVWPRSGPSPRTSVHGARTGVRMHENFPVETAEARERVVPSEKRHVLADELPAWIDRPRARLEEAARQCGGVAAPFTVHQAEASAESGGPAEVCVPVADADAARA